MVFMLLRVQVNGCVLKTILIILGNAQQKALAMQLQCM